MVLRKILSGAALGVLALASAAPGLAQGAKAPDGAAPAQVKPEAAAFDKTVARRMSVDELKKQMDVPGAKVIVVDARAVVQATQMIKGAVHVPMDKIQTWAKDVPKDTIIVSYCA